MRSRAVLSRPALTSDSDGPAGGILEVKEGIGAEMIAAIAVRGVTRRFSNVVANEDVTFHLARGEVHALLGENGAGKTTLCKILTGLYQPDEGELLMDGHTVRFESPRDALRVGIFMVHQHFRLVERLTVAENVVLGWAKGGAVRRRWHDIETELAATSDLYRVRVDPRAYIWQLSVGERQRVEILKALYREARVLILDEPTAVLTPQECDPLFVSLRAMAAQGKSVLFISHKLPEVLAVCSRVTVLRKGRVVGALDLERDLVDLRSLSRMMVGREVNLSTRIRGSLTADAPVALSISGLRVKNNFGREVVHDVSLDVRSGEVLGVAGVAGNGQRELADATAGLRARSAGTVALNGRVVPNGDPRRTAAAGMAYVPEDRLGTGLALGLKVSENLMLKAFRSRELSWGPFVSSSKVRTRSEALIREFEINGTSETLVKHLSGGQAQKVLLARELSSGARVVVAAAPTRGLDVAATDSVRQVLLRATASGVAVLLITEDLDEVMDLADRIAVVYEGRIMGVVDAQGADREQIGLMMAGIDTTP